MKKTIGVILLAVFLALTFTACGGGGGGSSISNLFNKGNDKASKDNFAGKKFGDGGVWAGGGSTTATNFEFGTDGTVTVTLGGASKGVCTYNKPTGLSNVNLVIKDSGNTEIVNWTVNFDSEAHSFNVSNSAGTAIITFNLY